MARTRIGRGGGCALLLAALLGAGVAGCSVDEEPAPAETATTADDDATATPDSGGTGEQVDTLEVDPADAVGEATIILYAMQEESVRKFLPTLVDRENLKEYGSSPTPA